MNKTIWMLLAVSLMGNGWLWMDRQKPGNTSPYYRALAESMIVEQDTLLPLQLEKDQAVRTMTLGICNTARDLGLHGLALKCTCLPPSNGWKLASWPS